MSLKSEIILNGILAVCWVGSNLAAYGYGVKVTENRLTAEHAAAIQKINATNATNRADMEAEYRRNEQQMAAAMADKDAYYLKELQNEKAKSDRAIADLRAGTLRVRGNLRCLEGPAQGGSAATGTGTGLGHAGAGSQLQGSALEFLLSEAGRADEAVKQLQACQSIIRMDRGQ